jgi:hypothetical protein
MSAVAARLHVPQPRTVVAVALCALAGLAASFGIGALVSHHGSTRAADAPFGITAPAGWTVVRAPASGSAALRRDDGRGILTVRPGAPLATSPAATARSLTRKLAARFKGFRPVSARVVGLHDGRAFAYTFVRHPGVVQTVAVATIGARTWIVAGVVSGDSPRAASELGSIVASLRR